MTFSCPKAGWLLASPEPEREPGLWLVFHSEEDGILAADLTTRHPDLSFAPFSAAISGGVPASPTVLLGGPIQNKEMLLIPHQREEDDKDSYVIDDAIAFQSFRYHLLPGKAPKSQTLAMGEGDPINIYFQPKTIYLVIVGIRLWDEKTLRREMESGLWKSMPATPDILFNTPHDLRRARALNLVN